MTMNFNTLSDNGNPLADEKYPSSDNRLKMESALYEVKNLATVLHAYLEREELTPEIDAAMSIVAQIEARAGEGISAICS